MNQSAKAKLGKARAALLFSQPFFATLLMHLEPEEASHFPTMATDGRKLFYNPDFVLSLPMPELEGVLVHEVMHPACKHHARRNGRDSKLWNKACDYAINPGILAAGLKLPPGGLVDSRFNGMSAEAIFRMLEQGQQGQQQNQQSGGQGQGQGGQGQQSKPGQSGQGQGQPGGSSPGKAGGQPSAGQPGAPGAAQSCGDPGGCGEVLDAAPAHDVAGNDAAAAEWDAKVKQAVAVAKARGAGKLPAGLQEIVAAVNKPVLDHRAIFRRFIDESTSRDYSFMKPNRRHIARGVYLPGTVPDRPSHIVAMIDSSGSMSDSDVAMLRDEIQAALDEGAADRVTIAFADTRVGLHATYEPGERIDLKGAPRGGTSFVQPFEWIAENCPDASAILYLTDMDCGGAWGEQPAAPVLWIVTGEAREARRMADRAPFGESIILAE